MTAMIEVKVAELSGAALDWAVAKVEQLDPTFMKLPLGPREFTVWVPDPEGDVDMGIRGSRKPFSPRRHWFQGGPLIDKYKPWLSPPVADVLEDQPAGWDAEIYDEAGNEVIGHAIGCPTALVAVCRAVVLAKLGPAVSVPAELVGGAL